MKRIYWNNHHHMLHVMHRVDGRISPIAYTIAIPTAYVDRWIAGALYVAVAIMWLVPDRRIEHALARESETRGGRVA